MIELPPTPSAGFTKEQRAAFVKMKALLEIQEDADEAYNAIEGAGGGTIISTDVARHLDEKYTNEVAGKLRDLKPSWNLAWRYSQDRLERELSSRNKRKTVRFMAGGWA